MVVGVRKNFSPNQTFNVLLNIKDILSLGFIDYLNKIGLITFYVIRECFKYPIWLANFFSLLLGFYYLKNDQLFKFIYHFLLINFLFIFTVYLLTPENLVFYLNTTLDRLMLQTSGIYMILFIYLVNNKKINF